MINYQIPQTVNEVKAFTEKREAVMEAIKKKEWHKFHFTGLSQLHNLYYTICPLETQKEIEEVTESMRPPTFFAFQKVWLELATGHPFASPDISWGYFDKHENHAKADLYLAPHHMIFTAFLYFDAVPEMPSTVPMLSVLGNKYVCTLRYLNKKFYDKYIGLLREALLRKLKPSK